MSRLIFFIFALALGGCNHLGQRDDDKDSYVFHDDYYYRYSSSDGMSKIPIVPKDDEYYILFGSEFKEEVLIFLKDNGFTLSTGPNDVCYYFERNGDFYENMGCKVPDSMKVCVEARIKGTGDIANIPHLIYINPLYINQSGEICGISNRLWVILDKETEESHYETLSTLAQKLGIIPYDRMSSTNTSMIRFACTDNSRGNPGEISNWLYETAGYIAEPIWDAGEWH